MSLQMTFLPQWVCEVGKVVSEYLPEPKREKHYEEVRKICCKGEVWLLSRMNSFPLKGTPLLINSHVPSVWFQFKRLILLHEFKEGFLKTKHFKCLWKCKEKWKELKLHRMYYFARSISRKDLCEWAVYISKYHFMYMAITEWADLQ